MLSILMKIRELIQYWKYVSFSFRGRINRTCWWLHFLFTFPFIYLAGGYLYYEVDTITTIFDVIVLLFGLILYYTYLPAQVKRFHDTNRSGWNLLGGIIPIIGALYILIVCGFFKGIEGDNKYGVPPRKMRDLYIINLPKTLKKFIPYLFVWVIASVILGLSLGTRGSDEANLVVWLIIFLILIVNPIVLPKIWEFVLERIKEISKAIRGEN